MAKEKRRYSLQRRILLFYLVPLCALLAILFLYLRAYRFNVETLAETTFQNIVEVKHLQMDQRLGKIRTITKDISYSSLLQQYLVEMDESEKVKTYQHLQGYLRAVSTSSDSVISAYASVGTRASAHMGDGYYYLFEEVKKELISAGVLEKNGQYLTDLRVLTSENLDRMYGMYFYVGSTVYAGSAFKNTNIISAVIYDPYSLIDVDEEADDHIAVVMVKDTPVYLSGALEKEQLDRLLDEDGLNVTLDGTEYFFYKEQGKDMPDIQLLYLVERKSLVQHSNVWEQRTTLFIILSALVLSLSVTLIINSVFLPIRQLCREVEGLKHYGETLLAPRARELAALTDTFNSMSHRISSDILQEKDMIDQQYQLQIQKNRMEIQAFRNQINPHFLFNTLECINGMVRYYQLEPVSEMITNLSGCFRYSLYSPMLVKLSEEIGHLNNYLDIIETRFPGKYCFIRKVDSGAEEILVPSLLLQPLAENAVTHAFFGYNKKARPTIVLQATVDEENNYLYIHISDNGAGMTEEKLEEITKTMRSAEYVEKHISLNNVYRRLTLLYGEECVTVKSRSGCYTRISVRIPVSNHPDVRQHGGTHLA